VIVHRSHPEARFTIIPDATVRDPRLSYLARGLLGEMLSRPDDWATSADAIWRRARSERGSAGEGRDVLRAAFAELAAAGYLHRERRRVGRGRFATDLHVFDAPDGREAWLAARVFVARAVDNHAENPISAGRTDDDTGRRRRDQGKRASSQVAPTYGRPGVGPPGVGPPGVGPPGVSTETYDGDLSTETMNGNQADENHARLLTSPVPVEGERASPGQKPVISISDEEWERRERVAAAVLGPLPQTAP
jgi:hypothetical protein